MFKKAALKVSAAVLSLFAFTSCSNDLIDDNGKINVVCTVFPCYDWAREIVGNSENVYITYLLDDGSDLHSFQPTAADMIRISECDVFVYIGGESDHWVDKALENAVNKDMKVVRLMDSLAESLEVGEHNHAEHEGEEHDHSHEEAAFDEHIWLSLNNAQVCVTDIAAALSAVDSENVQTYSDRANAYNTELQLLDRNLHMLFDENPQTMIFGDQFPFVYFTSDYGIEHFAAFSGCSADTEASFKTITELAEKVDELNVQTVFTIENSNCNIAEAIISNTADKSQEIAVLDSIQSVNKEQIDNGYTYKSAMESNYKILKEVYSS